MLLPMQICASTLVIVWEPQFDTITASSFVSAGPGLRNRCAPRSCPNCPEHELDPVCLVELLAFTGKSAFLNELRAAMVLGPQRDPHRSHDRADRPERGHGIHPVRPPGRHDDHAPDGSGQAESPGLIHQLGRSPSADDHDELAIS